jgi:starch-binding outer membrane protein, SusD/RagB family
MNLIHKYLKASVFAGILLTSSCDVIDVKPTHILTGDTAFRNLNDVESHLVGTYALFRSANYYGSTYGVMADMMTDDLSETVESLGNFRSLTDWTYVANDAIVLGAWEQPYRVINNANIVIANVEKFEEEAVGQRTRIKGQALAMRALAHFDLLRFFGQSYDRNSTALGIPIKLETAISTPTRNTVQEVYNRVYQDLTDAKTLLSGVLDDEINGLEKRTLIDGAVVSAIQARVALYAKDYPTAIASATEVIENSGLGLASMEEFGAIWSEDAVANEVLWAIAYLPGQGQPGGNVFFSVNNRLSFRQSEDVIGLYDSEDDIRFDAYFSDNVPLDGRDGELTPVKYLGRNGATDGNVNFKVFRLAEMYLIRAEAYSQSNQDLLALADLNTLRAARIAEYTDVSLSGTPLKNAIATERRKELFLEGHRWFDLRRQGASIQRGGDCAAPATQCELAASSHRWVWPIPQSEIDANPVIASQQNSGYN